MPTLQHPTPPRRTWSTTTVVILGVLGTIILMGLFSYMISMAGSTTTTTTTHTTRSTRFAAAQQLCVALGDMALTTARLRDQGVSREWVDRSLHPPDETTAMRNALRVMLDAVYTGHRYDPPADVAKATQAECLVLSTR